jgi:hypothetical protein
MRVQSLVGRYTSTFPFKSKLGPWLLEWLNGHNGAVLDRIAGPINQFLAAPGSISR